MSSAFRTLCARNLNRKLKQLGGGIEVVMMIVNVENDPAQRRRRPITQQLRRAVFVETRVNKLV